MKMGIHQGESKPFSEKRPGWCDPGFFIISFSTSYY